MPVGSELIQTVSATLDTLDTLRSEVTLPEALAAEIDRVREDGRQRLTAPRPTVAVVGEKKAGKSTFLNAVLGAPLLGVAVREITGTPTRICSAAAPDYIATFADGSQERMADWYPDPVPVLRRQQEDNTARLRALEAQPAGQTLHARRMQALRGEALQAEGARLTDRTAAAEARRGEILASVIAELTDLRQRAAEVVALTVSYPAAHLPADLALMDTPGVNTERRDSAARAWAAVAEADGCILLVDIQRPLPAVALAFARRIARVVPHVIPVLTKLDRAREDAELVGGDPDAEILEARRIARGRFASGMGRELDTVPDIGVASRPACGEGLAAAAFAEQMAALMALYARERDLLLAGRTAAALGDLLPAACQGLTARAEELSAQVSAQTARTPPTAEVFLAERRRAIAAAVAEVVGALLRRVIDELPGRLAAVEVIARARITDAADRRALRAAADPDALRAALETELAELDREIGEAGAAAGERIGADARAALHERYGLPAQRHLQLPAAAVERLETTIEVSGLLARHQRQQGLVGVGGAAAGAALGVLLTGGLAVPALLALGAGGAAAALFRSLEAIREECLAALDEAMEAAAVAIADRLHGQREALEGALVTSIADRLAAEVEKTPIAERIAEHAAALAALQAEQERLPDLRAVLQEREEALRQALEAAARESVGLCLRP